MSAAIRVGAQALLYAAFFAAIGLFATRPQYRQIEPGSALIRVTLSHAAQPAAPCRKRTPEELAQLPPNMRAPLDCPRGRSPVRLEVELDGAPAVAIVAQPSGLARDGPSTIYRRIEVRAGTHRIRARLADTPDGRFTYTAERELTLGEGRVLTLDFNPGAGGFLFLQ